MSRISAALLRGDGIGPEVIGSAVEVMAAAGAEIDWVELPAGAVAYEECGDAVPPRTREAVRELGVGLKGPMGNPRSGYSGPNQALRAEIDAFANVRSVQYFPHRGHARWPGLDLTIVRDQAEDLTRGVAQRTATGDTGVAMKITTRAASERVARFTYQWAVDHGRTKVTIGHLAPSQRATDGLFLDTALAIAAEFPSVTVEEEAVDPLCTHLLQDPTAYQILLTQNVYGGILCGVLAGLAGSVGLMPGGIFGPSGALFEAGHGNAPKYAGKDTANPVGCILSGAMLLDHVGQGEVASRIRGAVREAVPDPASSTRDVGGAGGTSAFTKRCCDLLSRPGA